MLGSPIEQGYAGGEIAKHRTLDQAMVTGLPISPFFPTCSPDTAALD